jgi:hypothetical protein
VLAEQRRHIGEHLFLLRSVRIAERLVFDETHARVSPAQRFAYRGEYLFAAKHAIPHLSDRLAVQIADPGVEIAGVPVRFPERPDDFVQRFAFAHRHDSCKASWPMIVAVRTREPGHARAEAASVRR